jgi:hypothetical protein
MNAFDRQAYPSYGVAWICAAVLAGLPDKKVLKRTMNEAYRFHCLVLPECLSFDLHYRTKKHATWHVFIVCWFYAGHPCSLVG